MKQNKNTDFVLCDYQNKCDCSEDDKCGCTYPNNMKFDTDCDELYLQCIWSKHR